MSGTFNLEQYRQQRDKVDQQKQAAEAQASRDPLAGTGMGADTPGLLGTANRWAGGVVEGEVEPAEGLSSLLGFDLAGRINRLDPTLVPASQTTAGNVGRVMGNIFNPTWRLLGPILGPLAAAERASPFVKAGVEAARERAGPALTAAGRVAQNAIKGGVGSYIMPGEDRGKQAEVGLGVGALVGLPGAGALLAGYPSLEAAIRHLDENVPGVAGVMKALRSLSTADFNRVWNRYAMRQVGRRAPVVAGRGAMAQVEKRLGDELEKSITDLSYDARGGTPTLDSQQVLSDTALKQSGNPGAADTFNTIIDKVWKEPLELSHGQLTGPELQKINSTLEDRIRDIRQGDTTGAGRLLAKHLEDFREEIFNTTSGTAAQKAAYRNARRGWNIFSIARDASPPTEPSGLYTPSDVMKQLDIRNPKQVPVQRARHQDIAEAAQRALLLPGRAAANVVARRPPVMPSLAPMLPPGLAAAGGGGWGTRRPSLYQDDPTQPPTYQSEVPGR